VTLIWPENAGPTKQNGVVIDPCFTRSGWQTAIKRLASVDAAPEDIGFFFESHPHGDHKLHVPRRSLIGFRTHNPCEWKRLDSQAAELPELVFVPCPGHEAKLQSVRFYDQTGETWIASDAVLNRDWLVAWEYYWPNVYSRQDVVETWRSVAKIVAAANTIIPGHGAPISVDAGLLEDLIERFPQAEYASQCPEVLEALKKRWSALQ
jgi:glyoxylase-like metal-dependent hydrolase (beta-lactamase superfamily II)